MSTEVEVTAIPDCDICKVETPNGLPEPAMVDGKTVMGPWANMCERHWTTHGIGQLGTGFGQLLKLRKK